MCEDVCECVCIHALGMFETVCTFERMSCVYKAKSHCVGYEAGERKGDQGGGAATEAGQLHLCIKSSICITTSCSDELKVKQL